MITKSTKDTKSTEKNLRVPDAQGINGQIESGFFGLIRFVFQASYLFLVVSLVLLVISAAVFAKFVAILLCRKNRLTLRVELNTISALSGFPAKQAGLRHAVFYIASKDAPIV